MNRCLIVLFALGCAKTPPQAAADGHPLDVRPEIPAPKDFAAPLPTTFELANGAKVWFVERPGLPLVSVRMIVAGGSVLDPADQPGVTAFTDAMLTRGAGELDEKGFAEAVEQLALDLHVSTHTTSTWLSLDAHRDQLVAGLGLLSEAARAPRFDRATVDQARDQRLGRLSQALDNPNAISSIVANNLYWANNPAMGHFDLGTAESIAATESIDLVASWETRFGPSRTTFVVAGDIASDDLRLALDQAFTGWEDNHDPATLATVAAPAPSTGMFFVDNPGASQSILKVIMPGPAPSSAENAAAGLGTVVLGGTFTSRLNRLLREEKGYTYGARARLDEEAGYGQWTISTAVRGDVSGPALADLMGELQKIRDGIDAAELKKAKGATATRLIGAMGSRASVAAIYAGEADAGRTPGSLQASLLASMSATEEQVDAALVGMDLDQAVVLVVGDLDKVRAQIEEAMPGTWTVLARP